MSASDPFESPKLLIDAAREDIQRFEVAGNDFFIKEQPAIKVEEFDPETRDKHLKIRITKPPSRQLRIIGYNIIGALRHALDQAVYAAVLSVTGSRPDQVYFPFATSPADLDSRLKAIGKKTKTLKIPAELHPIIKSFEAYPRSDRHEGGNTVLAHLGALSGPNKHEVVLGIGVNAESVQILSFSGASGYSMYVPGVDPATNEMKVMSFHDCTNPKYNIIIPTQIVINEPRIMGQQALGAFDTWLAVVEKIVNSLQTETMRILAARGS